MVCYTAIDNQNTIENTKRRNTTGSATELSRKPSIKSPTAVFTEISIIFTPKRSLLFRLKSHNKLWALLNY